MLMLMSFIYIILFDFFIASKAPTLSWLVGWMVIFAAYSSVLLYKYNSDKDSEIQDKYAAELATWQDNYAEEGLAQLRKSILEDATLKEYAATPHPELNTFNVEERLFSSKY